MTVPAALVVIGVLCCTSLVVGFNIRPYAVSSSGTTRRLQISALHRCNSRSSSSQIAGGAAALLKGANSRGAIFSSSVFPCRRTRVLHPLGQISEDDVLVGRSTYEDEDELEVSSVSDDIEDIPDDVVLDDDVVESIDDLRSQINRVLSYEPKIVDGEKVIEVTQEAADLAEDMDLHTAKWVNPRSDPPPKNVLGIIDLCKPDTRIAAYMLLLGDWGTVDDQVSLRIPRLATRLTELLCPIPEVAKPETFSLALVEAVKLAAEDVTDLNMTQRRNRGGWMLLLLDYIQRLCPIDMPAEAFREAVLIVGTKFKLYGAEDREEARSMKAAKIFKSGLYQILRVDGMAHQIEGGGAGWEDALTELTDTMSDLFQEVRPSVSDAIRMIRVGIKTAVDDMLQRASQGFAMERETTSSRRAAMEKVWEENESLTPAELLAAGVDMARLCLDVILELQGTATIDMDGFIKTADEYMSFTTALGDQGVMYENYVETFITDVLTGKREIATGTSSYDALLLEIIMTMDSSLAHMLRKVAFSKCLVEAIERGQSLDEMAPLLPQLQGFLNINEASMEEVRDTALYRYVLRYVGEDRGVWKPSKDDQAVADFFVRSIDDMRQKLEYQQSKMFSQKLKVALTDSADGGYNLDRVDDDIIQSLKKCVELSGLSQEGVIHELSTGLSLTLKALLGAAGAAHKAKKEDKAYNTISKADDFMTGLVTQLFGTFNLTEEEEICKAINVKSILTEAEEFWASELCWEMLDLVNDKVLNDDFEPKAKRMLLAMGLLND